LNEETPAVDEKDWYKTATNGQGTALDGVNKIASATIGNGTNPNMLIRGFQNLKDFEGAQRQLAQIYKSTNDNYATIQDMLRGEMEGDNNFDVEEIKKALNKIGYSISYKPFSTGSGMDPKTITITKIGSNTEQPTMPDCLKGGRWSPTEKVWWLKLGDGFEYAFSTDGSYRRFQSTNKGYYKCENGAIKYSRTPFNQQDTTKKENGQQQVTYRIPNELKDAEGVKKFQTWMEKYYKGWFTGNNPIDGVFGPKTKSAWDKRGNDYLEYIKKGYDKYTSPDVDSINKEFYKFKPQSPSTEQPDDVSQGIDQGK
jgi:hypothetical protein